MRKLLIIPIFGAIAVLMLFATGCTTGDTSAKSDETVCVFDGSERGSQKLKYQILPGQEPRDSDSNDEVVRIPTSNRFYAAFADRSKADAGAPERYLGYARGNVPLYVQGQDKFRFNVDRACEWYALHGRRNANDGNLGFNARNNESASDFSPWVRWLNENFGTIMAATIKNESETFTWPELVYGNDPEAPARPVDSDIAYGKYIGFKFTERLNDSIGGQFFCGTNPEQWDDYEIDPNCPPIYFEVGPVVTKNEGLMASREETEALRAAAVNEELAARIEEQRLRKELEASKVEARIKQQSLATERQKEKTAQLLLQEQVKTARLEALTKPEVQKCLIYAKQGLDCAGQRPDRIILGASAR